MPDAYDVNNIVTFLGGFGKARGEVAAANQADKEYKLQTIQTLFTYAEGKRSQAEASQALAADASLSPADQERHSAEAEAHRDEGSRIYAGASELFGMIDDKPKTGKKENPAMQFLKFVNPFKRRGPESGEFEQELQGLLAGISGGQIGGIGGGGASGAGDQTGVGLGKLPITGQGSGVSPEGTVPARDIFSAMSGERLTPSATRLTQAQPQPPAATPAETFEQTGLQPLPGLGAPLPAPTLAGAFKATEPTTVELYPHISQRRDTFRNLNQRSYDEYVRVETQTAVEGLQAFLQSTKERETLVQALQKPGFTKHYRPAKSGMDMMGLSAEFTKELGRYFPEISDQPPEANADIQRNYAAALVKNIKDVGGAEYLDSTNLSAEVLMWGEAQDQYRARFGPADDPVDIITQRVIDITRRPKPWTEDEERVYKQYLSMVDSGQIGSGAVGAGTNLQVKNLMNPEGTMEIAYTFNPRNGETKPLLFQGKQIPTMGIDISKWMIPKDWIPGPGGSFSFSQSVDLSRVIQDLRIPGSRVLVEQVLGSGMVFDDLSADKVQTYLDEHPEAGQPQGWVGTPGVGTPPVTPGESLAPVNKYRNMGLGGV